MIAIAALAIAAALAASAAPSSAGRGVESTPPRSHGMEFAKRRGPAAVPPVVVGGVRYEPLRQAKVHGFAQDGGVIVAVDEASGRTLWTAQLYTTAFDRAEERDVQEVYVQELALDAARHALRATDEQGRVWFLDLATRAVTPVHP